jgi:hypothetical protein
MGGDVDRQGQPGSPGSGGASPYLRRGLEGALETGTRTVQIGSQSSPHLALGYAFSALRSHSAESGSSSSTRSLTLSAEIVTNNPSKKPRPDRPLHELIG